MSKSINELRKQLETDVLRMQFFCLDPKWENFRDICANRKLVMEQGDNFDVWKVAAISTFGKQWNSIYGEETTGLNPVALDSARSKYHNYIKTISSRLLVRPTRGNLDKMWYFFFATGDINFLRTCFETAGNTRCNGDLRDVAIEMFETFRKEYIKKAAEARESRPNFFAEQLELYGQEASRVFTEFQTYLDDATKRLDAMEQDKGDNLSDLLQRITGGKVVTRSEEKELPANAVVEAESPVDGEDADRKKTRKELEDKAAKLFDEVAKEIFPKLH